MEEDKKFQELIKKAFSKYQNEAFEGSIELARYFGVPEDEILKSTEEGDQFFLGEM